MKIITFILILNFQFILTGQRFSSTNWVKDGTTISFGDPTKKTKIWQHVLNGLRIVYEPQLGQVVQSGNNRFENDLFLNFSRIGFETNLYDSWIAFQLLAIAPGSIQYDSKSELRINNNIIDPAGKVTVDYGIAIGLSFLDGIISLGYGGIFYDKRDFKNVDNRPSSIFQSNFLYFNLQPISLIKAAIKQI